MPIDLEALLEPISEAEPAGADIRYHAITKKLREARRQEDDFSQGIWKRDVKLADYATVLKLAPEVLAKQSKDLQVAGWLTEALLRTEGWAGLRQGLELLRGLLERFWDTVHPQPDEDGDLEIRSAPLRWVGSQLDVAVKSVALLRGGDNWYEYKASRGVPLEEESSYDPSKQAVRQEAIAEGKRTQEEIAFALAATSFEYLQNQYTQLEQLIVFIDGLSEFCDEKFKASSPEFNPLKASIEEVMQTARVLLKQKDAPEPEAPAAAPAGEESFVGMDLNAIGFEAPVEAPQQQVRRAAMAQPAGAEPANAEQAIQQILQAARYLRREMPGSPAPYLAVRAVRWGELRASGDFPDQTQFEAPPTEVRMELKRLMNEGQFDGLREAAETAAGQPYGRVWLDLQRYAVTACRYTGLDIPATAILSGVRALLKDYPELPQWMLVDDTPAANSETRQWLSDEGLLASTAPPPPAEPPPPAWSFAPPEPVAPPTDSFQLALDAARSGRFEEAVNILSQEIAHESSARARFLLKSQLAQICLAGGQHEMGRSILLELSQEIGERGLEKWESGEVLAQPLSLLYQCMNGDDAAARRDLYARICRLDPPRALRLGA